MNIFGVTGTYTDDATASNSRILSGYTAYKAGTKLTGTMPNLSTYTTIDFATGNTTPVIPADTAFHTTCTDGVKRCCVRYSGMNATGTDDGTSVVEGYLTGNTLFGIEESTMAAAVGLTAAKLAKGNTVMGISGTFDPGSFTDVIGSSTRVRSFSFTSGTQTSGTTGNYNGTTYYCKLEISNGKPESVVAWYDITENVLIVPGKYAMYHSAGDDAMNSSGTWTTVSMKALTSYDCKGLSGDTHVAKEFKIINTSSRYYSVFMNSQYDYFCIKTNRGYTNEYIYWYKY